MDDATVSRQNLLERGFKEVEEFDGLKPGVRICHAGERWFEAVTKGTAEVLHVMRHGTDEEPDGWTLSYGRPNIEVVVRKDDGTIREWADYHCEVVPRG